MNLVEITLAGINKLVNPLQAKAYASLGWKILGADQESPKPKAQGALPKTKKVKK